MKKYRLLQILLGAVRVKLEKKKKKKKKKKPACIKQIKTKEFWRENVTLGQNFGFQNGILKQRWSHIWITKTDHTAVLFAHALCQPCLCLTYRGENSRL